MIPLAVQHRRKGIERSVYVSLGTFSQRGGTFPSRGGNPAIVSTAYDLSALVRYVHCKKIDSSDCQLKSG